VNSGRPAKVKLADSEPATVDPGDNVTQIPHTILGQKGQSAVTRVLTVVGEILA
jgi:hypothetical protein